MRSTRVTVAWGSARQLDGTRADRTRPSHYPVEAVCLECGQPIRCERWFLGGWGAHQALLEPRRWQTGVTAPPLRAAWPVITMRCIRPTARIWPGTLEPERG